MSFSHIMSIKRRNERRSTRYCKEIVGKNEVSSRAIVSEREEKIENYVCEEEYQRKIYISKIYPKNINEQ